jgi:hypothetical protein
MELKLVANVGLTRSREELSRVLIGTIDTLLALMFLIGYAKTQLVLILQLRLQISEIFNSAVDVGCHVLLYLLR